MEEVSCIIARCVWTWDLWRMKGLPGVGMGCRGVPTTASGHWTGTVARNPLSRFPPQDEIGETAVTVVVAAFPGDEGQAEVHVEVGFDDPRGKGLWISAA